MKLRYVRTFNGCGFYVERVGAPENRRRFGILDHSGFCPSGGVPMNMTPEDLREVAAAVEEYVATGELKNESMPLFTDSDQYIQVGDHCRHVRDGKVVEVAALETSKDGFGLQRVYVCHPDFGDRRVRLPLVEFRGDYVFVSQRGA
jgi:hypothetical protein